MSMTTGLIALALLAADGPGDAPGATIITELRVLEFDSLAWRETAGTRLEPVAGDGATAVWTAPHEVLGVLEKAADTVCQAPRITSQPNTEVMVSACETRFYVARLGRVADAPVGHARRVAFSPHVAYTPDGFKASIRARLLDQGVLARVVIDDTRCLAMHTAKTTEAVETKDKSGRPHSYSAAYQVPEIVTCHVENEWLIPKNGVLVVSLGVHTMADKAGKAKVRERVALITARPASVDPASPPVSRARAQAALKELTGRLDAADPAVGRVVCLTLPMTHLPLPMTVPIAPVAVPVRAVRLDVPAQSLPAPAPGEARSIPAVPSRSMPFGFNADGRHVPLPPLPDEAVEPASAGSSAEARPTPQTKPAKPAEPAATPVAASPASLPALKFSGRVVLRTKDGLLTADSLKLETTLPPIPARTLLNMTRGSGGFEVPLGTFQVGTATGEAMLVLGSTPRLTVGLKMDPLTVKPLVQAIPALDPAVAPASVEVRATPAELACPAAKSLMKASTAAGGTLTGGPNPVIGTRVFAGGGQEIEIEFRSRPVESGPDKP